MFRGCILFLIVCTAAAQANGAPGPWRDAATLGPDEVILLTPEGPQRARITDATARGFLVVDLSDEWAPFLLSDSPPGEAKPNAYRASYVRLASDRSTPNELLLETPEGQAAVFERLPPSKRSTSPGKWSAAEMRLLVSLRKTLKARRRPNFLEVYGITPTLSVLARRLSDDGGKTCFADLDTEGLGQPAPALTYRNHARARRVYRRALADAASAEAEIAARGETRLRAVRAVQARLRCEGLLASRRYTDGMFDLNTHLALAEFERKNDILGWGFLDGETRAALQLPPLELHMMSFRRLLAERVADAAGIIEDGSVGRSGAPATYTDAAGIIHPVPNLIDKYLTRLLADLRLATPEDLACFLGELGEAGAARLRVAFRPPPLPPYYASDMELFAEIDRGDVWYEFPYDDDGKPRARHRSRFPALTLFVSWKKQKIPLVRWETTIGSWRNELGPDGQVYLAYKNSPAGLRVWKNIVAAPAWIPPESTPGRDLLTRKVFDPAQPAVTMVNTEVMGPSFSSAYGMAMAIHHRPSPGGWLADDELIRTHGSVDYTSIPQRFSHGCHRLVNKRAVRLFDFILKHRAHKRLGSRDVQGLNRAFSHEGKQYQYTLTTRGYYYELSPPVPVTILSSRVRGMAKAPLTGLYPKPGVSYADAAASGETSPGPGSVDGSGTVGAPSGVPLQDSIP